MADKHFVLEFHFSTDLDTAQRLFEVARDAIFAAGGEDSAGYLKIPTREVYGATYSAYDNRWAGGDLGG